MNDWQRQLTAIVLGNSIEAWLYAASIALTTLLVLSRLRAVVVARASKQVSPSGRGVLLATLLHRTHFIFFLTLALLLATRALALGPRTYRIVHIAVLAGVWVQVALWASAIVVYLIREALVRRGAQHLATAGGFVVISLTAQALVWITALALALANAGVNVAALIAGLGTGGAALALALRGFLSNLFASASIALDKLFSVGDQLVSGQFQGKVEHIGNRTTSLRSVNGEQILISNADLLKSRLRNFGRVVERREVLSIWLPRTIAIPEIREALHLISLVIHEQPLTRLDRCHFIGFAPDALQIEAVYYARAGTVAELAEVRDSIDSALHTAFARSRIRVEYPVQRAQIAFA